MTVSVKRRWLGGYVHQGSEGLPTFIIERRVRGHRFHVSTRCHTERAALKQLERFEADPFGYQPEGEAADGPLLMTAELISEHDDWQRARNTPQHAAAVARYLADWQEDLAGRDLRRLTLRDALKPALDRRVTCRGHRIAAIKVFFSWLRRERGLLTSAQDATLDLAVPQTEPEKRKRRKAVAWQHVEAALGKLTGPHRDCLLLLTATGWHVTELERFCRGGEVVPQAGGEVLASLVVRHKGGDLTRTPITHLEHLEAAQRLRAAGVVPRRLNAKVREACRAAEVAEFTLGVMRHSVATWAAEAGASADVISQFLGHKDRRTTARFYIDLAVPTNVIPLRIRKS